MFCPHCGKESENATNFCPACGKPLSAEASAQSSDQTSNYNNTPFFVPETERAEAAPVSIGQRSVAASIVLSIITCGIYGIYWFICMVNDINSVSEREEAPSGGIVFLLTLITCNIYGLYWMYKAGCDLNTAKRNHGITEDSGAGLLYLLLDFFGLGIISYALIQAELNHLSEQFGE